MHPFATSKQPSASIIVISERHSAVNNASTNHDDRAETRRSNGTILPRTEHRCMTQPRHLVGRIRRSGEAQSLEGATCVLRGATRKHVLDLARRATQDVQAIE